MNKEEFVQWRHSTITEEVFSILGETRQAYVDKLVGGATLESQPETARTIGILQAFDYLLTIHFEDVAE